MTEARDSRRELAAVALALLLPIPLFVASGLRVPLPSAVERGLASLDSGGAFESGGVLDPAVVQAPPVRSEPVAGRTTIGRAADEPANPTTRSHATGSSSIAAKAPSASDDVHEEETTGNGSPPVGDVPVPGADDRPTPTEGGSAGDPAGDPAPQARRAPGAATVVVDSSSDPAGTSVSVDVAGVSAGVSVGENSATVEASGTNVDVPVPQLPAPPPLPPLFP